MRTFLIIWVGQFVSLIGSEMTNFGITIWAWQVTGQATPLAFILVVTQLPRLIVSLFAGVWVDRFDRKQLMILGDLVAGISTILILGLFLTDNLRIWHLYLSGAVNGVFGYIQGLALTASTSSILPKQYYARAAAFNSIQMSGTYIIAPTIAGVAYAAIGLSGILSIDVITFLVAIGTLSAVYIPRQVQPEANDQPEHIQWQAITFGFSYIAARSGLLALLCFWLVSNFFSSASFALLPAVILARNNNNSAIWGTLFATFGLGGVLGGITLSFWKGPRRMVIGILTTLAIWKIGLVTLALAKHISVEMLIAFVCGFCSPFPQSYSQAIWMAKVEPAVQGRVFSTRFLLTQLATPLGAAIAGPLADFVFEPMIHSDHQLTGFLQLLFGNFKGAGMALGLALFSACGVLFTLSSFGIPALRNLETNLPDYDAT
ncbi:major facilitator superfamily MFS_1 [Thalassoporum mexicanum PCC 7367]|uniref:MFS transporter n=1 Tax=Thalassoporum mexicanum TaxID=3457544 RepID=UPI00029FA03C|nr:MFS transporter [Pseudanabaena sp. PCC 7367]AFY71457.1 major facilitator superfamily MFS_1 [Pseudanabaena sp. PCC 7367]